MISKEQILTATDEDLSRMAGEVLHPEPSEHKVYARKFDTDADTVWCCHKCKVESACCANMEGAICGVADPIPLTPAEAFKWRDWMYETFGIADCMDALQVVHFAFNKTYDTHWLWWTLEAQPKHYIKAAMLCKEQSNE